ncbi:MAG: tetratricopeptide repeat protein [Acidobacteria bacterium]|nr:tetratricopeptide repeat protein [Acidobacteriota bacterium]
MRTALPEHRRQPDSWGSQAIYEEAPAASLVGSFRSSVATWLFARAQEYLHAGVILRPATKQEQDTGAPLASHGDEMTSHHGSAETGMIPPPGRDPRWVWGMIERETQPYMDVRNHRHHDLREALPLFRMMTWSDPYFIEAYSQGAYLVFSGAESRNIPRAIEFLGEGLHYNPRSWQLHKDYAHYHFYNLKEYRTARSFYEKAIALAKDLPQEKVDETEFEAAWAGLVQTLRQLEDREAALEWSTRGLLRFPRNATCRRTFKIYGVPVPKLRDAAANSD